MVICNQKYFLLCAREKMFYFGLLVWNFLYCSIVSSFRMTKISPALYSSDCHLCDSPQTAVGTSWYIKHSSGKKWFGALI